ncbi:MAG: 23S rRNA (pseudouridine(1915)-N(3))-methyltransferase RlmH [Patescibacteria group bacterium]|nr:23S rRNA (pseudouridine(1915)-N(3))-methyltransferase RlmH [Patescibacteria group bacterium]
MMNNIQIKCIGTLQEPWHKQAIHMYTQRYQPFGKLEILELPEGHKGSAKPNLTKTLQTEADSLLKNIDQDTYLIAMDESGKQLTSTDFADLLNSRNSKFEIRNTNICFVIGGSWGLDKSIIDRANLILSLGKMTLPHSLARIILLEQLYRAQMINSGRKYHK